MKARTGVAIVLGALLCLSMLPASAQDTPKPQPPEPTVPEIFTLMGQYVRVAYNNEGFATLGYRVANDSVGKHWMLLEVGLSLREGQNSQLLTRDAISLQTPDNKIIRLATQQEANDGELMGLQTYAKNFRDKISYFPNSVVRRGNLGFFQDVDRKTMSHNEVELNNMTGTLGRIFFHVPDGIKTGQHWLIIRFANSEVHVPFRILTKEEAKEFSKTWEDIKDEHDEATKAKQQKAKPKPK